MDKKPEFKYKCQCNKCFKILTFQSIEPSGEQHNVNGCDGWLILIAEMVPTKPIDLQTLLNLAYLHEINIQINWFWDSNVDVKIGDDMNGYEAESNVYIGDLTEWLYQNLKRVYPEIQWTEMI